MKDLLKIVKWEVLKNIKNKTFIVLTFVFPIIMIAIGVIAGYFAQAGDGGLDLNVGIIDKTGELSAPLQTSFQENDFEASFFTADREDEIDKIMSERKLDGFLIIPENVVEENKATYYFEELEGAETDFIEDTLSSIIIDKRLINSGYQPDEVLALTRDVSIVTQSLDDSESFISMMLPFGMAFLMVFGSFLSGSLLMQGIIKEKTNRIVEIILSSVPAKTLMGGKVLGYGILGLIQVAIWLCSALLIVMYFDYRVLSSFFSLKILIMFIYFI
ncbi:MAG: ABC transporter permease, partial [Halothermotrichaceae bacterium]